MTLRRSSAGMLTPPRPPIITAIAAAHPRHTAAPSEALWCGSLRSPNASGGITLAQAKCLAILPFSASDRFPHASPVKSDSVGADQAVPSSAFLSFGLPGTTPFSMTASALMVFITMLATARPFAGL